MRGAVAALTVLLAVALISGAENLSKDPPTVAPPPSLSELDEERPRSAARQSSSNSSSSSSTDTHDEKTRAPPAPAVTAAEVTQSRLSEANTALPPHERNSDPQAAAADATGVVEPRSRNAGEGENLSVNESKRESLHVDSPRRDRGGGSAGRWGEAHPPLTTEPTTTMTHAGEAHTTDASLNSAYASSGPPPPPPTANGTLPLHHHATDSDAAAETLEPHSSISARTEAPPMSTPAATAPTAVAAAPPPPPPSVPVANAGRNDARTFCSERSFALATPRALSTLLEYCTTKSEFRERLLQRKRLWRTVSAVDIKMLTKEACHHLGPEVAARVPGESWAGLSAACARVMPPEAWSAMSPTRIRRLDPGVFAAATDLSHLPSASAAAISDAQAHRVPRALCADPALLPQAVRRALAARDAQVAAKPVADGGLAPVAAHCIRATAASSPYAEDVNGMIVRRGAAHVDHQGDRAGAPPSRQRSDHTADAILASVPASSSRVLTSRSGMRTTTLLTAIGLFALCFVMWRRIRRYPMASFAGSGGSSSSMARPSAGYGGL